MLATTRVSRRGPADTRAVGDGGDGNSKGVFDTGIEAPGTGTADSCLGVGFGAGDGAAPTEVLDVSKKEKSTEDHASAGKVSSLTLSSADRALASGGDSVRPDTATEESASGGSDGCTTFSGDEDTPDPLPELRSKLLVNSGSGSDETISPPFVIIFVPRSTTGGNRRPSRAHSGDGGPVRHGRPDTALSQPGGDGR